MSKAIINNLVLHIPFGYLFLDQPPAQPLPIPDLRTLDDDEMSEISPDLHDVLTNVLYKHYLVQGPSH